jgi:hypothetical protein
MNGEFIIFLFARVLELTHVTPLRVRRQRGGSDGFSRRDVSVADYSSLANSCDFPKRKRSLPFTVVEVEQLDMLGCLHMHYLESKLI